MKKTWKKVVVVWKSLVDWMTTPFWATWFAAFAGMSLIQENWVLFVLEAAIVFYMVICLEEERKEDSFFQYSWKCPQCSKFRCKTTSAMYTEILAHDHLKKFHGIGREKRDFWKDAKGYQPQVPPIYDEL